MGIAERTIGLRIGALAAGVVVAFGFHGSAQADCVDLTCTVVVDATQTSTLDMATVPPGGIICLEDSTQRGRVVLSNVVGSEASPIVIRNCGGAVHIDVTDQSGIALLGSRHFRLSGAGDSQIERGISITVHEQALTGNAGVYVTGEPQGVTIDHLAIDGQGTGIHVPVAPDCMGAARGPLVLSGFTIRDNHVEGATNEGIRLGAINPDTVCAGNSNLPATLENVVIRDNVVIDAGYDGIQLGGAASSCTIERNRIVGAGAGNVQYQDYGLNLLRNTECTVGRNVVDGGEIGLSCSGRCRATNNVVRADLIGIFYSRSGADAFDEQVIVHNTVLGGSSYGIRFVGSTSGSALTNNLVVSTGTAIDYPAGLTTPQLRVEGNLTPASVSAAGFVDAAGGDFHLLATSPAVDEGFASASYTPIDLDGQPRDSTPDVGADELVAAGTDAGSGGSDAGSGGDGGGGSDAGEGVDGGTGGDDEPSGCECRTGGRGEAGLHLDLAGMIAVVLVVLRQRRTRAAGRRES